MYGELAVLSVLATVVVASTRTNQPKVWTSGAQAIQYGEQPGELFVVGDEVGGGNYSYYTIMGAGYVTILLDSVEGDADLYVSSSRKQPQFSLDSHEFHSTTCGLDRIDIGRAVPRPLYIGVYGHPSKEMTRYHLLVLTIQVPQDEYAEYAQAPDVPDEIVKELQVFAEENETQNNFGEVLLKLLRFLVEIAVEILLH